MSNKLLLGGIVGVVVGFLVGSMFPYSSGGLSQAQTEKLKRMFPVSTDMRMISGSVKKIDGKRMTVEIAPSSNPFDEWSTTRIVTVTDTTKIIKTVQKDPKEFQKEMDAYSKTVGGVSKDPTKISFPPNPIKEENIKLSDIKVGDFVTVEADHNIKSQTAFTATRIAVGMGGGAMGGVPAGVSLPAPPVGSPTSAVQNVPLPSAPPTNTNVPKNLPVPPVSGSVKP